jgi:hypothetical protein
MYVVIIFISSYESWKTKTGSPLKENISYITSSSHTSALHFASSQGHRDESWIVGESMAPIV